MAQHRRARMPGSGIIGHTAATMVHRVASFVGFACAVVRRVARGATRYRWQRSFRAAGTSPH